ncbi:hypothetical protein DM01DRAFT_1143346 [Hesseltinella vesiculosa]|uniref:Uncharacterized protein n=1 Tax=Hesseltinella vesiculosa TaxID=101127 RepID=A0A1X2G7V7_9FUNG|nr:hypothetical protein DM01DRAFT_1143346 [Hesseltinella vesiculosa]
MTMMLVGLFFAMAVFLVGQFSVDAFCFENALETDNLLIVQLTNAGSGFVSFRQRLRPGQKECCNYQNLDCNQSNGGNNVMTTFQRSVFEPQWDSTVKTSVAEIDVPSGGFCRHSGDPADPTVEVYNAYGQQIEAVVRRIPQP